MKRIIPLSISIISIIILLIQYSCDFEPTGINFVKIDSTANPGTLITEGTLNQDTIFLFSQIQNGLKVNWKFKLKQKIFQVEFFQDGKKLLINQEYGKKAIDSGSIFVKYDENNIKYSDLVCRIYCASGTGSMNDLYTKDTTIIEKIWPLVIFPSKLNLAQITSCIKENRNVVVSFTKYTGPYFNGYYFVKNELDTLAFTLDQSKVMFIDTTYFGECSKYKIITKLKSSYYSSDTAIINYEINPEFLVTYQGGNKYKVKLLEHKYSDRIDTTFYYLIHNYKITEQGKITMKEENTFYFTSANLSDYFSFNCRSEKNSYPNSVILNTSKMMANSIEDSKNYKLGANDNVYAINQINSQLKCFSLKDNKFIKTIYDQQVINYELSPNGENLIVINNNPGQVILFNTVENLLIDIINLGTINSKFLAVSNNKILAFWTGELIDNKRRIILYDMNKKLIFSEILDFSQTINLKFSDNNKYFSTGSKIYDISGATPVIISDLSSAYVYAFDPDNDKNAYFVENNTLSLKNFLSNSLIRDICPFNLLVNIDLNNHTISYKENSYKTGREGLNVLDTKTWDLRYSSVPFPNSSLIAFYNNTLFSSNFFLPFE